MNFYSLKNITSSIKELITVTAAGLPPRSLECDRLRVHRNLLVALLLQFCAMLVIVEPYVTYRSSPSYNDLVSSVLINKFGFVPYGAFKHALINDVSVINLCQVYILKIWASFCSMDFW